MAWPTDKASNQYTDSGQDRIADARAEINKNITNVNAIIDEFNISSPSDGDLLQYSSSSGKWEQVSSTFINAPQVILTLDGTGTNLTGSDARFTADISEIYDPANISSINGTTHNLASGNYFIEMYGTAQSTSGAPAVTVYPIIYLFDTDLSADIKSVGQSDVNGSSGILEADSAADDFKIQYQMSISSAKPYDFSLTLKFTKIA